MRLITTLCVPNCPPERSSSFIGSCVGRCFVCPCPVSPWNTFLWCFLAGLRLHTSFCSWVSDAIRRPRWFALSHRRGVLPAAPPLWGGMVLWWRPVIQISSSLYVETQTSGLLSCMLHHSPVPCTLWPEWLPTEFLESCLAGSKVKCILGCVLPWRVKSQPRPCACPIYYGSCFDRSFPKPVSHEHLCVAVFVHRTVSLRGIPDVFLK